MGETKPEEPPSGIQDGPGARDLVRPDPAPAATGSGGSARGTRPAPGSSAEARPTPSGGSARGSLRGGQWSARPEGDRPGGAGGTGSSTAAGGPGTGSASARGTGTGSAGSGDDRPGGPGSGGTGSHGPESNGTRPHGRPAPGAGPGGERPVPERPGGGPGAAPPVGDGPEAGGGAGDPAGIPAAPAGGGSRRAGQTTAVVAAAAVLVIGLGATVAIRAHHGHRTANAADTVSSSAAASPTATTARVKPGLPTATPVTSKPSKPQHTQAAPPARQAQQAPPAAPRKEAVKSPPKPSGPAPVSFWSLGSGALGTDSTNAHPATVYDVLPGSARGGCGVFNGKDSHLDTNGPVLDTSAGGSFTVSAWVYLTSTANFATAVSQDGNAKSAFYLQYSKDDNRWALAGGGRALSSAPPALNTWTHLVGVRDAATSQVTLYVDGVRQGSAKETAPLASTGSLAIGRAKFNGQYTDFFPGQINDVEVFDKALSAAEISKL